VPLSEHKSGISKNKITQHFTCIAQLYLICTYIQGMPIPVAVQSKAWVCGHSIAGIAGSNSAGGMDVCLLCLLRVVQVAASATN
jgi:hypothetical protein